MLDRCVRNKDRFPTFPAEEPIDVVEVEQIEGTVRLFDSEGNIRKVPVPSKDPADPLTWSSWIANFEDEKQSIFVTAAGGTNWKDTRGKEWFTAEYVEELVEILEVMVGEGVSVRILGREDGTEGELENWKERTFWVCGCCQGESIEGVKRKGMEHYARMGGAWKRLIDRQFADNIGTKVRNGCGNGDGILR